MKRLPRVTSYNTRRKASKRRRRNSRATVTLPNLFARTQESFGEQEASLANLNATEATCDVSPAEQLVETQTIAETIEILAEVIGHAINTFDQDPVNKIRQHKWNGLDKTTFSD